MTTTDVADSMCACRTAAVRLRREEEARGLRCPPGRRSPGRKLVPVVSKKNQRGRDGPFLRLACDCLCETRENPGLQVDAWRRTVPRKRLDHRRHPSCPRSGREAGSVRQADARPFEDDAWARKKSTDYPCSIIKTFVIILPVGLTTESHRWLLPSRFLPISLAFPSQWARPEPAFSSTRKDRCGSSALSIRSSILSKKLYVGNLTYNVNESDLEALFTPFGAVQSARSSSIATPTAPRGSGSWRWITKPMPRRPSRRSTAASTMVAT